MSRFSSRPPPQCYQHFEFSRAPTEKKKKMARPPPEKLSHKIQIQTKAPQVQYQQDVFQQDDPFSQIQIDQLYEQELFQQENSMALPPPESLSQLSQVDNVMEKKLNKLGKNLPNPDTLFASMKFFILWYDQTYPYGEYTGYQDHIHNLLSGVPIKIENDYQKAIRQLNTSFSHTKYILIVTGKKKKKLVKEVHDYSAIASVFIIKPFVEKVEKWSKTLNKVQVVRNFSELMGKFSSGVRTKKPMGFKHPNKTLLNYTVIPDPMILSQQSVVSLESELEQDADQLKFKDYYQLALQAFKEEMENSGTIENPLSDLMKKFSISSRLDQKEVCKVFLQFLDLALYFDEAKNIISGLSLAEMKLVTEPSSLEINKLIDSVMTLHSILENNKSIDETLQEKKLKILHEALYSCVLFLSINCYKNYVEWKDLYMMRMLLNDLDLCAKTFLHFAIQFSNFDDLERELFHASLVSDTRVSMLKEFWDEWKERTLPASSRLPPEEKEIATRSISPSDVVILNSTGLLNGLAERIPKAWSRTEYRINRDFLVDWETQHKLAYKQCYVAVEPTLSPSEFNQILDLCIAHAITPTFVMLLSEASRLAKEMFKGRWTVVFVYCDSLTEMVNYMGQVENNLDRDMWQYARCYDSEKSSRHSHPRLRQEDTGWELIKDLDPAIFSLLVGESALGTKLTGSLHYLKMVSFPLDQEFCDAALCACRNQAMYWRNYASLFGISSKYANVLGVNCAKMYLRAYTLQTNPPFYKMLNDAFRTCDPTQVVYYRSFFTSLQDEVKAGVMKKYIGFVYRGTFFNKEQLALLKEGERVYLTCFTSTSKSESVARDFARKAGRNVLLEIELDPKANSNVDLHSEKCSLHPEEQEVLLLPFSYFEVQRIYKEETLTVFSLKELVPEYQLMTIKGVDYYNQSNPFYNFLGFRGKKQVIQ